MDQWGPEGPVIGIDLGTTYSCVAAWRFNRVEIIPNDQGNRITPSYVAFDDEDGRLIGEGAKHQALTNPENTIFDAKRLIGRRFSEACVQSDIQNWPFEVVCGQDEKPMIVVRQSQEKKMFTAEEISAAVLCKMKETAESYLGCTVKRAVVTVPAYFNDSQRNATKDAGTIAGLDIMRIINEPTAAALAYGVDLKAGGETMLKKVVIFDLGGGTFDVSILEIKDGDVVVKATGGDTHLGGEDFDARLVTHFVQEFMRKHKVDLTRNKKALRRLRTECERAKRGLKNNAVEMIELPYLHENFDFHSKLTRAKFEDLNMELFLKCIEIVRNCLADAGMTTESIDDVVLVGGSTRILKVRELLKELFHGKPLLERINAEEAIAWGAAVLGAKLGMVATPEVAATRTGTGVAPAATPGRPERGVFATTRPFNDITLKDVAPLSLGTPNYQGKMMVFIAKNTPVPVVVEQMWTLTKDNLTSTTFPIYEGENPVATENNFLGNLRLDGITPAAAYSATIKIIFRIDDNGILQISAQDMRSGNEATATLSSASSGRLSREQVHMMRQESLKYKQEEERRRRRAEAKDGLERYISESRQRIRQLTVAPTHHALKRALEAAFEEALRWSELDSPGDDEEAYRTKTMELQSLWDSCRFMLNL